MGWLDKLERRYGQWGVPNVTIGLIICQAVMFLGVIFRGGDQTPVELFVLQPQLVFEGQVWRVLTFLVVPPFQPTQPLGMLFLLIFWWIFYMMGTALEQHWGVFRYNVFLGIGYLATVGGTLALAALVPATAAEVVPNIFLKSSVFLAFAWLYPDFQFLLFFILPIKVKWLALLMWIVFGFTLIVGPGLMTRLVVLATVTNFFVFFGPDMVMTLRARQRRRQFQARQARVMQGPMHRCVVCGTDSDAQPDVDFRYCTKCDPVQCYCPDHLRDHAHVGSGASEDPQRRAQGP